MKSVVGDGQTEMLSADEEEHQEADIIESSESLSLDVVKSSEEITITETSISESRRMSLSWSGSCDREFLMSCAVSHVEGFCKALFIR